MANVKITALEHLSSTQVAPEDVFVIDDVSALITRKITVSNVTRYVSNALGNAKVVEGNLHSFASYANANAAALSVAIASIETTFDIAADSGTTQTIGSGVLTFSGSQGINTETRASELVVRLANTGVTVGTYGGTVGTTTQVPVLTVDAQGRVTSVSNTVIQVDFDAVQANINLVQTNVAAVAQSANAVELRRAANTFYSYNTHSVISYANVIPYSNNTQSLGSASQVWSDLYVGPGSVHLGSIVLSDNKLNGLKIEDKFGNFTVIDANLSSISNTVTALSSDIAAIDTSIGDLAQLDTTAKNSLVSAINELAGSGSFESVAIGSYTFSEQITNNVTVTGATIFSMPKDSKRFAKLLINVEDLTYGQYQTSELLLVQDGSDSRLVEYGIVFTSTNPIATYETLFEGSNVIVRATAISSDNRIRVLKITT